jgi:hypothetical protein
MTGGLQACFKVRQEHGIRSTALNNIFNHTVNLPSTLSHLKTTSQNKNNHAYDIPLPSLTMMIN